MYPISVPVPVLLVLLVANLIQMIVPDASFVRYIPTHPTKEPAKTVLRAVSQRILELPSV